MTETVNDRRCYQSTRCDQSTPTPPTINISRRFFQIFGLDRRDALSPVAHRCHRSRGQIGDKSQSGGGDLWRAVACLLSDCSSSIDKKNAVKNEVYRRKKEVGLAGLEPAT